MKTKRYSCKQAKKGKTAYRTPSDIRYQLVVKNQRSKQKIEPRRAQPFDRINKLD